nr:MAG TPA: hypothetical protein [Caudoviricetes sp.]
MPCLIYPRHTDSGVSKTRLMLVCGYPYVLRISLT